MDVRGASKYVVVLLLVTLSVIMGCQAEKDQTETIEEKKDGITWIKNFNYKPFLDVEDPFQSVLLSLLAHYGKGETSLSLTDTRGYLNIGMSFLDISRKLEREFNLYSTFIELTFEEAKEEIAQDRPIISRRTVRGYMEDYVLIAGYDAQSDALMGYSPASKDPVRITKNKWEEEHLFLELNLSMIVALDEESIRKREQTSHQYWLQQGAEAVLDMNDSQLERAIEKIDALGISARRADYLKAYYYVFIKQELTPEIEQFLDKVYESGPTVSHAIEWKFLKHWTLGEQDMAVSLMREIEQENKFAACYLETLYIFEQIYADIGEQDNLANVQEIIAIKKVNPEYLGIPG